MLDIRIVTNPHLTEEHSSKLITELLEKRRDLLGPDDHSGQLDKKALDALKNQLKNNSKTIKVK